MTIRIEQQGRRHYLRGDTYAVRDQLRDAGFHWDGKERAWWTGKSDEAERMAERLADAPSGRGQQQGQQDRRPRDSEESVVAGRAEYKGKTYYVAGRQIRGETAYDRDGVEPVETRDGAKVLLYFRDGSSQFWADRSAVRMVRTYDRPQTIRSLREYAEQAKANRAAGRPADAHSDDCRCYRCRMEYADVLEDMDYFREAEAVRNGADW